jgi:ferredoxin
MKNRWGAFVCACRGSLPIQASALGQPAPLTFVADDPLAGAREFAAQARAQGVDQIVASCCEGLAPLQAALAEARVPAGRVHSVDLKRFCFGPHGGTAAAHAKAARMIQGAMAAAEHTVAATEQPFSVGSSILLVLDQPEALALAPRLEPLGRLTVLIQGPRTEFAGEPEHRVVWGRVTDIHGRLGDFRVTLSESANGSGEISVRTVTAAQVVWASARIPPPVRLRTGLHVATIFSPAATEATAGEVAGLMGDFLKPDAVAYLTGRCAGGAAQHEACGRCIPACPYDAVARDPDAPLRVRVDHAACEGCGACVAACPTGALTYTDPSGRAVANRIAGMLDGAAGDAPLVVLHCSERGRRALEADTGAPGYTPRALPVEVPCLRYVSPDLVLAAFRVGAAGVALLGCADCPHGERDLLYRNLAVARGILNGFGVGMERLQLITVPDGPGGEDRAAALRGLDDMAGQVAAAPLRYPGKRHHADGPRESIADALEAFIAQGDREPGEIALADGAPFAVAEVRAEGCTLCRSCANVCPTHAFRFDEAKQTLSFRHIACVACGLCEQVCPEDVITLRRTLRLDRRALEDVTVVQDEMIACARCAKPYINRRALEAVEKRVLNVPSLAEAFAGARRNLLRMCPDCRGVTAMQEVERGWQP